MSKTDDPRLIPAVIYARYSSFGQREESIEGQLRACRSFAEANGYAIVAEYIDRAKSATNDHRPDFQRMIKDSRSASFEAVIVYQYDRFSRNMLDSLRYEMTLERNGVALVSAREPVDDDTPNGRMNKGMLMLWAQFYSDDLSQKVRRGQSVNASKCKYNGGTVPWGYKVGKDGTFEVDEGTAPLVRRAFKSIAEGKTMAAVVQEYQSIGIRTAKGTDFGKNSLQRMLRNRRYLGIYIYGDTETPGGMPRLISDDLFNTVQKRLKQNVHFRGKRADYLLTGKLFCGHCDEMMVGTSGTSKQGVMHYYYMCKGKAHGNCSKRNVRREDIESAVLSACRQLLTPDNIRIIARRVAHLYELHQDTCGIAEKRRAVEQADREIRNLTEAIALGKEADILLDAIAEKRKAKEARESELREAERKSEKLSEPDVAFFLTSLARSAIDDKKHQKTLIQAFVNKIYLYDDGRTDIYFNASEMPISIELDKPPSQDGVTSSDVSPSSPPEHSSPHPRYRR